MTEFEYNLLKTEFEPYINTFMVGLNGDGKEIAGKTEKIVGRKDNEDDGEFYPTAVLQKANGTYYEKDLLGFLEDLRNLKKK